MTDRWWFGWLKIRTINTKIRNGEMRTAGEWLRVRDVLEKVSGRKRLSVYTACLQAIGQERTAELFRGIALPPPEGVEA